MPNSRGASVVQESAGTLLRWISTGAGVLLVQISTLSVRADVLLPSRQVVAPQQQSATSAIDGAASAASSHTEIEPTKVRIRPLWASNRCLGFHSESPLRANIAAVSAPCSDPGLNDEFIYDRNSRRFSVAAKPALCLGRTNTSNSPGELGAVPCDSREIAGITLQRQQLLLDAAPILCVDRNRQLQRRCDESIGLWRIVHVTDPDGRPARRVKVESMNRRGTCIGIPPGAIASGGTSPRLLGCGTADASLEFLQASPAGLLHLAANPNLCLGRSGVGGQPGPVSILRCSSPSAGAFVTEGEHIKFEGPERTWCVNRQFGLSPECGTEDIWKLIETPQAEVATSTSPRRNFVARVKRSPEYCLGAPASTPLHDGVLLHIQRCGIPRRFVTFSHDGPTGQLQFADDPRFCVAKTSSTDAPIAPVVRSCSGDVLPIDLDGDRIQTRTALPLCLNHGMKFSSDCRAANPGLQWFFDESAAGSR